MAKKKKNKLNKILKQRQLQQLATSREIEPLPTVSVAQPATIFQPPSTVSPSTNFTSVAAVPDNRFGREILRTLISLLIVAILLVIAVIIDRRTSYFTNFSNWLFYTLRLNNK